MPERRRTTRRGVFTNGRYFYLRHPPRADGKWKRFDTFDAACAFKDEFQPPQPRRDADWSLARPIGERPGVVYFIAPAAGGLVKIGFTLQPPEARLAHLQTGSPVPLEILGWRHAFLADEHQLHERFADARQHGEWFAPTEELLAEAAKTDEAVELERRERVASLRIAFGLPASA